MKTWSESVNKTLKKLKLKIHESLEQTLKAEFARRCCDRSRWFAVYQVGNIAAISSPD